MTGPSDPLDAAPGAATPGDATPGDAAPGDATPGDAAPGDATPGVPRQAPGPEAGTPPVLWGPTAVAPSRLPVAGWRPPGPEDGARASRGCLAIAAVVAFVTFGAIVSVIALVFLGGQIQNQLKGTVEFGTGGSACVVTGRSTTFPSSTTVHFAAHFARTVAAGETITVEVALPDGSRPTNDTSYPTTGDCVYDDLPAGLATGHYALEFRSGSEILSRGEFDVTP